jgi:tetratricopeptide (TPR) repeat protein
LAPPDWPLRADLQARIGAAEVTRLYQEASSLHQLKRYREAIESFKKLIEAHPKAGPVVLSSAYNTACCHALLGETDNALEWLEKAVKLGYSDADHIDKDSDLDSLRNEPRFRAIVEQLKSRQQ